MKTLLTTLALLALTLSVPVRAETVNCTPITTLPYTISTQGIYCLTGHLSTAITSGNAITIEANNVVLDLNGYKIGGLAAGLGTQATGIYATQRANITIRNGTVRGFFRGIHLNDIPPYTTAQGHVVEAIRADQNTYTGMLISGQGNMIRDNQVVATGGTTLYGTNASAFGMLIFGPGAQVLNNMVTDVAAQGTGSAIGIYLDVAANSVVAQNRVSSLTSPSGSRHGVFVNTGNDLIVRDNSISGATYGIYFYGSSTGKYFNNVTQGVTTPYTGGTAGSINN